MKTRAIGLSIVLGCLLTAALAWAEPLSPDAKRHFDAGVAYVDDPEGSKWEDAYKEFRAAYAISPNWKLMNNIGLCALHLERDGEAIESFRAYLGHGGESDFTAKQRKLMEKDIATLSASLVRVTLEFEPADAMLVDERRNAKGEVLVNQYPLNGGKASLGIHPGLHKFSLQAPGYVSDQWSFNADPASTHQHTFKLDAEKKPDTASNPAAKPSVETKSTPSESKPEPVEPRSNTAAYVGLAATGVFVGVATVTGILALGKEKDYKNTSDPAEEDRLKKSGETLALVTDIGIGAAVVSAGITTYLFLRGPSKKPTQGHVNVKVTPVASPNTAGVAVLGRF